MALLSGVIAPKDKNSSLVNEINRSYVLTNGSAKLGDLDVFRVDRVGVEACTIREDGNQPGIVRASQMKSIEPDGKILNLGYQRP